MRKIQFISLLFVFSSQVNAQSYWMDASTGVASTIRTTSSNNSINFPSSDGIGFRALNGNSTYLGLTLMGNSGTSNGASILLYGPSGSSTGSTTTADHAGQINYCSFTNSSATNDFGHVFYNYSSSAGYTPLMTIHNSGNVDINGGVFSLTPNDFVGTRRICGNSISQSLCLVGNSATSNSASITLFGPLGSSTGSSSSPDRLGQISYCSYTSSSALNDIGHSFCNYNGSGYLPLMTIHNTGNVDVANILAVSGGLINLNAPTDAAVRQINANSSSGVLALCSNTASNNGAYIDLHGPTSSTSLGQVHYVSYGSGASPTYSDYGHIFYNFDPLSGAGYGSVMAITKSGKVVIGSNLITPIPSTGLDASHPDGYLLYVQTGILTEKLKVANRSDGANWSDFVFDKDYNLMSINEVEDYIKKNKHLPEVPSADDVAENGIDVASMDAKLLQKIEELTLYIIEQQKEIDNLKKRINN